MPIELAMEMPVLKDILDAMGIMRYELDGFEADDIIGTTAALAEAEGLNSLIITGDRDALQLATDKTQVLITKKGISEFKLYDDEAMKEEYGFDHIQFIDYKALRGDDSDNIPGIPGVGEKTAIKLIQQFGSLENILRNTQAIESKSLRAKIEENAMSASMSKHLATIITNVPVEFSIADCRITGDDTSKLIDLYTRLEFKKALSELTSRNAVSPLKDNNNSISLKPYEFSEGSIEELFKNRVLTIDISSDDNHIGVPIISRMDISVPGEGRYYSFNNPDIKEIKNAVESSESMLCGFMLGKLYYCLMANGINTEGISTKFDCAVANYVLNPSTKTPGLSELLMQYFKVNIAESNEEQMTLFEKSSENIGLKMAGLEKLWEIQTCEVKENELDTVLFEIELPLIKVLASMESEGIKVNKDELKNFGSELKKQIDELEIKIYKLAGKEFNINSPMQLGNVLFEDLGIPSGKKTSKGYSTSAEVLEKLSPEHEIVRDVLEFRTLSKLRSTYVEGLLPLIDPEGKIHAHFQQTVTATGRISCTEPNLQNIPVRSELGRQLRKAFIADSDEYVLIGADYSQIELRVMAHMSEDPTLIKCFNDGLDIHRETASKVFNVSFNEVTSQMRSNAKAVNFGVIYGMSGFGLASELTITRKQAEQYISDYFSRFKDVKAFLDKSVAECKEKGYVRTLYGRKRNVPEINASQFMVRQLGERLAMNTPIQGTAADIIKIAMKKVYNALGECPKSKLILQIHDELIILAHKEEAEKVRRILSDCMEHAADLSVRLDISLNEGENWYMLK